MSSAHRKLLLIDQKSTRVVLLVKKLDCELCFLDRDCEDQCKTPPPPLIPSQNGGRNSNLPMVLILMLCVLGAAFAFLCYLTILKRYRSNLMNSSIRRRRDSISTGEGNGNGSGREEFMDEDQARMMINPIWYINTVGLQQSVIDSILVFKYKKGEENLIESSDCSVCLSEFQEDERLRLLPKCSHAFHIECIDTWLRSHKNCPLCRAPIVRESIPETEEESSVINNTNNFSLLDNTSATASSADAAEDNGNHVVVQNSSSSTTYSTISSTGINKRNDGFRVMSDLSHHRVTNTAEEDSLTETVIRRSVSMDAASASVIYTAVAKLSPVIQKQEEGCSKIQESELIKLSSDKVGNQPVVGKELIIHKSRKSFSFGRSLQKMPIRMKRSFSSSGTSSRINANNKSSLPRNRSVAEVRR